MSDFLPRRKLPERPIRGQFRITQEAVVAAERILPTFRGPDGDHEGIAFLAGLELTDLTLFTTVVAPVAEHSHGRVFCSRAHVLSIARASRAWGLAVLGQIHTHPGPSSYHSEGDDAMVLMPFEGMLSLV